jgi:uncharacterized MAPEG superfamily protein
MTAYPALPILVLALTALLFKSTLLSAIQVVSRARARTFLVAEDARLMRTTVTDREAPFVVRCGNVWRNDLENIPFFLMAALTFALLGGAASAAAWWFGGFVAVRYLHTAIYLAGLQPARTIAYLTGLALTWGLVISSLTLAVRAV